MYVPNMLFCLFPAPCQPGTYGPSGYDPCMNCPEGQYSLIYEAKICLGCPEHFTTLETGSDDDALCNIRKYFSIYLLLTLSR